MLAGIFSCGKSGTTLLLKLIDKFSNYYVHPGEIMFISPINDIIKFNRVTASTHFLRKNKLVCNLNIKFNYNIFWKKYYHHKVNELYDEVILKNNFKVNRFKINYSKIIKDKITNFPEFFLGYCSDWIFGEGKYNNYIFKTLEVNYLRDYLKYFPNMKFIHLIRDPYDVYASLVRATRLKCNPVKFHSFYMGEDNQKNILRRWQNHIRFISKYKSNKNHIIIKYEDLKSQPEKTIRELQKFLKTEIIYPPRGFSILKKNKFAYITNTAGYPHDKTDHLINKSILDTKKKFRYPDNLITEQELMQISYLLKDDISKFNYKSKFPNIKKKTLLFKYLMPMKWEFRFILHGWTLRKNKFYKKLFLLHPFTYVNFLMSFYYFIRRRIDIIFN